MDPRCAPRWYAKSSWQDYALSELEPRNTVVGRIDASGSHSKRWFPDMLSRRLLMDSFWRKVNTCVPVLLAVVVSALAATQTAKLLFRHDVAAGLTGYDVPLEVRQLTSSGHLDHSTWFPVFPYSVLAVAKLTHDPISAVKLIVSLLGPFLAFGLFVLIRRLTDSNWLGALAVIIAETSVLRLYLATDYSGALFSSTLLVWACVFTLPSSYRTGRRRYLCVSLGLSLGVAAFLSDPSAIIIVAMLIVASYLVRAIVVDGKAINLYRTTIIALALWLAPLALLRWGAKLTSVPLAGTPQADAGWLGLAVDWREKSLVCISATWLLVFVARGRGTEAKKRECVILGSCALYGLLVLLNPFLHIHAGDLSALGAIGGLSHVLAGMLVSGLVWIMWSSSQRPLSVAVSLVAVGVMLGTLLQRSTVPYGLSEQFLSDRHELVAGLTATRQDMPRSAVIIAPRELNSLLTYTTDLRSETQLFSRSAGTDVFMLLNRVPSGLADPAMVVLSVRGDYASILVSPRTLRGVLLSATPELASQLEVDNQQLAQSVESLSRP